MVIPERAERHRRRIRLVRLLNDDPAAMRLDGPSSVGRVMITAGQHDPDGSRTIGFGR